MAVSMLSRFAVSILLAVFIACGEGQERTTVQAKTTTTDATDAVEPVTLIPFRPGPPFRPRACVRDNCTNDVCRENGLVCCGKCDRLDYAPLQVCQCCPRNYYCCPQWLPWLSAGRPACCPRGSTCNRRGGCTQNNVMRPRPSETACQQCDPMKLAITVDNQATRLYLDGVLTSLSNPNDWRKVDVIDIPADTRVIAVKGRDVGVIAGMLASIGSDYLVTDSSWKCTTTYYFGWMQPSFNDASWPSAVVAQTNSPSNPIHHTLPEISTSANWIWTRNFRNPIDRVVYCRGRLPTDICDKDYGNCTNPCAAANKECCQCGMSHIGPTKVCSCCPSGSTCCSSTVLGSRVPGCCPPGFTCYRNGFCRRVANTKPIPPQIECGPCRNRNARAASEAEEVKSDD